MKSFYNSRQTTWDYLGEKHPDLSLKPFMDHNDVFSDAVNFALKTNVLKPEDLNSDRELKIYLEKDNLRWNERDVLKYVASGRQPKIYITLENQFEDQREVALRLLGYVGTLAATIFSNRGKNDPIPMIIPVVINYSRSRMNGRRLSDLWDQNDPMVKSLSWAAVDLKVVAIDVMSLTKNDIKSMRDGDFARLIDFVSKQQALNRWNTHLEHERDFFIALRELTNPEYGETIKSRYAKSKGEKYMYTWEPPELLTDEKKQQILNDKVWEIAKELYSTGSDIKYIARCTKIPESELAKAFGKQ